MTECNRRCANSDDYWSIRLSRKELIHPKWLETERGFHLLWQWSYLGNQSLGRQPHLTSHIPPIRAQPLPIAAGNQQLGNLSLS